MIIFDEIYKKQVISLSDAAQLGTVDGIYLDKDTLALAALSVGDLALAPENIVGKDDFVTVAGADALTKPCEDYLPLFIGQKALTRSGKALGEVTGLLTGRKYVKPVIGDTPLPTCKIEKASEGYLIVNARAQKSQCAYAEEDIIDIKDTKPEESEPLTVIVPSLSETRFEELDMPSAPPESASESVSAPDYSFLLGRKVEREISDLTRTFFVSPGTIISEAILACARKAGKIVDLAINSAKI